MKKLKIVHISPTPLVAAPGKIACAQRITGHDASCIVFSDYPSKGPLANKFIDNSILYSSSLLPYMEASLSTADIIHIHNNCPPDKVEWILKCNQNASFIYQIHSPMREGPLFLDRTQEIGLPFSKFLVVGQHWSKLYPQYTPVPNIIFHTPSINQRKPGEKLRIAYSPTHKHAGRWTSKYSEDLDTALSALVGLGLVELMQPENPVHPNTLMYMRRSCHLSIDEIATGGFHQVSLEGMCAGNVVINGSDYFGKVAFSRFSNYITPPFISANSSNIREILMKFANDVEETNKWQKHSYEYFKKYLSPRSQVQFYDRAYGVGA